MIEYARNMGFAFVSGLVLGIAMTVLYSQTIAPTALAKVLYLLFYGGMLALAMIAPAFDLDNEDMRFGSSIFIGVLFLSASWGFILLTVPSAKGEYIFFRVAVCAILGICYGFAGFLWWEKLSEIMTIGDGSDHYWWFSAHVLVTSAIGFIIGIIFTPLLSNIFGAGQMTQALYYAFYGSIIFAGLVAPVFEAPDEDYNVGRGFFMVFAFCFGGWGLLMMLSPASSIEANVFKVLGMMLLGTLHGIFTPALWERIAIKYKEKKRQALNA